VCEYLAFNRVAVNKLQILVKAPCQKASSVTITSLCSKANDKYPMINKAAYTVYWIHKQQQKSVYFLIKSKYVTVVKETLK